jgi:hypothetical protein
MEKKIKERFSECLNTFRADVEKKIEGSDIPEDSKKDLLEYISSIGKFDVDNIFLKKKRTHATFPNTLRCISKRSDGEQCSRRKREGCEYCGTHSKGSPYGTFNTDVVTSVTKMEVWAQEIGGIHYYLDNGNNVYNTEDIINNKLNPRVIAKYEKNGDIYSIPAFNI